MSWPVVNLGVGGVHFSFGVWRREGSRGFALESFPRGTRDPFHPKDHTKPKYSNVKESHFLIQPSQACVWEYLGIFSPDIKFERWFFANITSFCWIFETFQQTFNARKIISISLFRLVYYFLREIVLSEAMFSNFNVSAKTKKHSFLFQGN